MVLVALFDETGAFLVVLEEGGGELAGDQVPRRGLGFVDLTEVGVVGEGLGVPRVTGQHTYIVGWGGGGSMKFLENGVEDLGGLGEHEIVFENQTVTVGVRGGLEELGEGVTMTQATSPIPLARFGDRGDTDDFVGGDTRVGHFLEELVFTVFAMVQVDIIDDIDMGVPGGWGAGGWGWGGGGESFTGRGEGR